MSGGGLPNDETDILSSLVVCERRAWERCARARAWLFYGGIKARVIYCMLNSAQTVQYAVVLRTYVHDGARTDQLPRVL